MALILVHFGQLPGVALFLGITWAIYSAIKKASGQPPILALVYETLVFGVIALIVIIYLEIHGQGALHYHVPVRYTLMMLSGLLTCVPVMLFATAAKKVPLFLIGIFQYISSSLTLILGIFLFKEPIDSVQMMAFGIIWVGLIIFTIGQFRAQNT